MLKVNNLYSDCGRMEVENGQVSFPAGTKYSASAVVVCNNGYHLTANNSALCLHDGDWDLSVQCEINGKKFIRTNSELSLQRQHLFPKMLSLK